MFLFSPDPCSVGHRDISLARRRGENNHHRIYSVSQRPTNSKILSAYHPVLPRSSPFVDAPHFSRGRTGPFCTESRTKFMRRSATSTSLLITRRPSTNENDTHKLAGGVGRLHQTLTTHDLTRA